MMNVSPNDYIHLKWPLALASILTTFLAFILMLSFRSDAWFNYELIHTDNRSINSNSTTYSRILEYGSIGLWTICAGASIDPNIQCDVWTKESRPHSFSVIIVLVSCALFLVNLTVFPSWGATILIVYNTHNRYVRHILAFIWILLLLTLCFTVLLLVVLLLIALTQFSSPGRFIIDTKHLFFYSGHGLFYARFGKTMTLSNSYILSFFFFFCFSDISRCDKSHLRSCCIDLEEID